MGRHGLSRPHRWPGCRGALAAALLLTTLAPLTGASAADAPGQGFATLGAPAAPPDSAALARLHAAAARDTDDVAAAVAEADALSRAGREGVAARLLAALGRRWPDDASVAVAYARHLVRWRRHDLVEGALAPVPGGSPLAAEAEWLRVAARAGQLRFAAAADAARRAAAGPGPGDGFREAAATLDRLRAAQEAADARPGGFAEQLDFGRGLGESGLFEEAYRRLHRARAADTTSAEPDYWIAEFLQRERRLEPAARTLERALATDSTHRAARLALAEVLVRLDRWREAVPQLERCVAGDPGDARAGYNLACLLARDGRTEEALRALRRALEAGYDRWEVLTADPDLAPLRGRPEFEELLRGRPAGAAAPAGR